MLRQGSNLPPLDIDPVRFLSYIGQRESLYPILFIAIVKSLSKLSH